MTRTIPIRVSNVMYEMLKFIRDREHLKGLDDALWWLFAHGDDK